MSHVFPRRRKSILLTVGDHLLLAPPFIMEPLDASLIAERLSGAIDAAFG